MLKINVFRIEIAWPCFQRTLPYVLFYLVLKTFVSLETDSFQTNYWTPNHFKPNHLTQCHRPLSTTKHWPSTGCASLWQPHLDFIPLMTVTITKLLVVRRFYLLIQCSHPTYWLVVLVVVAATVTDSLHCIHQLNWPIRRKIIALYSWRVWWFTWAYFIFNLPFVIIFPIGAG